MCQLCCYCNCSVIGCGVRVWFVVSAAIAWWRVEECVVREAQGGVHNPANCWFEWLSLKTQKEQKPKTQIRSKFE